MPFRTLRTLLARALVLSVSIAALLGPTLAACVNGKLTKDGESALVGLFALACPFEAAVPVLGPGLAGACPGEEQQLQRALDKLTPADVVAAIAADAAGAGAGPPAPSSPVPLMRLSPSGTFVHCGWADASVAPQLQRALLDAGGDR